MMTTERDDGDNDGSVTQIHRPLGLLKRTAEKRQKPGQREGKETRKRETDG